jgi:putative restriction endonuclease
LAKPAVVAVTDKRWFDYLRSQAVDERLDEVNFWRPVAQTGFSLEPGGPLFFRLKHPINAIAGYGFFAHSTKLPIDLAWQVLGFRNGDATWDGFLERIADYRRETTREVLSSERELMCIFLREVRFLPEHLWIPWRLDEEWRPNIVAAKRYDLEAGPGQKLADLLRNGRPPDLVDTYEVAKPDPQPTRRVAEPVAPYKVQSTDQRIWTDRQIAERPGQGSFRVRVLDAYERRCAVTGERAIPVLEAAHIQPYLGPQSNHIQNGLSLRADLHRLFDSGYVTVTPDLRFEVSKRLKDDFENGAAYLGLAGSSLAVLPDPPSLRPSTQALEWHASNVFRG